MHPKLFSQRKDVAALDDARIGIFNTSLSISLLPMVRGLAAMFNQIQLPVFQAALDELSELAERAGRGDELRVSLPRDADELDELGRFRLRVMTEDGFVPFFPMRWVCAFETVRFDALAAFSGTFSEQFSPDHCPRAQGLSSFVEALGYAFTYSRFRETELWTTHPDAGYQIASEDGVSDIDSAVSEALQNAREGKLYNMPSMDFEFFGLPTSADEYAL